MALVKPVSVRGTWIIMPVTEAELLAYPMGQPQIDYLKATLTPAELAAYPAGSLVAAPLAPGTAYNVTAPIPAPRSVISPPPGVSLEPVAPPLVIDAPVTAATIQPLSEVPAMPAMLIPSAAETVIGIRGPFGGIAGGGTVITDPVVPVTDAATGIDLGVVNTKPVVGAYDARMAAPSLPNPAPVGIPPAPATLLLPDPAPPLLAPPALNWGGFSAGNRIAELNRSAEVALAAADLSGAPPLIPTAAAAPAAAPAAPSFFRRLLAFMFPSFA